MDWQGNSVMGDYPFYPVYENQPNQVGSYLDYDESNSWEDGEADDDFYTDQGQFGIGIVENGIVGSHGTGEPTRSASAIPGVATPPLAGNAEQKQDKAWSQEKAALLRAKLLEKRASSRGPVPTGEPNSKQPSIRPPVERQGSDSAVERLLREGREAAEAQAKQNNGTHYGNGQKQYETAGSTPNVTLIEAPLKSSAKASKGSKQKSPKTATAGKTRNTQKEAVPPVSEARLPTAGRPVSPATRNETKRVQGSAGRMKDSVNSSDRRTKSPKDIRLEKDINASANNHIRQSEQHQPTAPSRSETLRSTSTIHQETMNKKNGGENKQAIASATAESYASSNHTDTNEKLDSTSGALVSASAQPEVLDASSGIPSGAALLYTHYFDDLDDWLDMTGYHDRENREKLLSLYRRKAELDRQMAEVDRELEQTTITRSRSIRPQSLSVHRVEAPKAISAMPPPPTPGNAATAGAMPSPKSAPTNQSGTKRPHSPERQSNPQHADKHQRTTPISKVARTSSGSRPETASKTLDAPTGPRRRDDSIHGLRIRGAEDASAHKPFNTRPEPSRGRARSHSPLPARRISLADDHRTHDERGRYATREPSPRRAHPYFGSRSPIPSTWNAYRPGIHEPNRVATPDHHGFQRGRPGSSMRGSEAGSVGHRTRYDNNANGALGLGLQRGGCRYFMIKSWNHENVQTSQRENTWATQVQNEQLFAEAFKSCRHVIFCFSVNNSKAFQGYARMESPPGSAPTPSWVKDLRWPCSPPFYIRWITTAETRFSRVGHLKNSLNEGQPVLVGRDGQEIEEMCGAALCEAIDEEGKWGKNIEGL